MDKAGGLHSDSRRKIMESGKDDPRARDAEEQHDRTRAHLSEESLSCVALQIFPNDVFRFWWAANSQSIPKKRRDTVNARFARFRSGDGTQLLRQLREHCLRHLVLVEGDKGISSTLVALAHQPVEEGREERFGGGGMGWGYGV